jgi:hypothetical protein
LAAAVAALLTEVQADAGITNPPGAVQGDVGIAADASFDVAFQQPITQGQTNNIYVRRFNADDTVKTTNGTILVASGMGESGATVRIAVRADGSFAVAYEFLASNQAPSTLFVNLYDANGNQLGNPIIPEAGSNLSQLAPAIGIRNSDGAFVVTWTDGDNTESSVMGRGFDATGTPLGLPFAVALQSDQVFSSSSVAVRQGTVAVGETALVVSYTEYSASGDQIFVQRYADLDGTTLGPAFQPNASSGNGGALFQAVVSINAAGNFVVAWDSANGMDSNIDFRVFDKTGTALTAMDQVVGNIKTFLTTPARQRNPAVALADSGQFLIAFDELGYTGGGPYVAFQQYKGSGKSVSGERGILAHGANANSSAPAIAVNSDGVFAIEASVITVPQSTGNLDPFVQTFKQISQAFFAVANGNQVEVRRQDDNSVVGSFTPSANGAPSDYSNGISMAFGDVHGDGYEDLVIGGLMDHTVLVYDGHAFATGQGFQPPGLYDFWDPYSTVGAYVAVADFNDDGFADVVTGASAGNPHVEIWSGAGIGTFHFSLLASVFAYPTGYNIGVTVAAGDLNGDGVPDLVTGATAGNPHVRVFDGSSFSNGTFTFDPVTNPTANQLINPGFFAYGLNFNIGAYVAVADIYGDGGDLVVGASSGNPEVRVYKNSDIRNPNFDPEVSPPANSFFANALNQGTGVQVAAGFFEGAGMPSDLLLGVTNGPTTWRVVKGTTNGGPIPPAVLTVNGITFQGDLPGDLNDLSVGT